MKTKQENKEPKNKVCYRCKNFTGYYTKGLIQFDRTKQGFCKKQEKIVGNMECCESWCNNYKRLYSGKKASMKVLSDLLAKITAIKQILLEEQEENDEI